MTTELCVFHGAERAEEEDPFVCWEYDGSRDCAFVSLADLVAVVRAGVESGTIKGRSVQWCTAHRQFAVRGGSACQWAVVADALRAAEGVPVFYTDGCELVGAHVIVGEDKMSEWACGGCGRKLSPHDAVRYCDDCN